MPRKSYSHKDRTDLYNKYDAPPEELFDEFKGKPIKYVKFNGIVGRDRYVLLTKEDTANKGIMLINVYWMNRRVYGVRVSKDKFTMYMTNDILVRFYMEYLYGASGSY